MNEDLIKYLEEQKAERVSKLGEFEKAEKRKKELDEAIEKLVAERNAIKVDGDYDAITAEIDKIDGFIASLTEKEPVGESCSPDALVAEEPVTEEPEIPQILTPVN